MQYSTKPTRRLFFDLETAVNKNTVSLMPEPFAPGNLKDPEKIAAAIAEKKASQIADAPLDPDYGRILCIGFGEVCPKGYIPSFQDNVGVIYDPDEEEMLHSFWSMFSEFYGNCIGYNIINFDLPYVLRRSFALGVKPSIIPNLAKFRTEPVTDLMCILYNWSNTSKGLKTVAKLYGISVPAEGVSGADVANMPIEDVCRYCMSDVQVTIDLFKKMNGVYFNL